MARFASLLLLLCAALRLEAEVIEVDADLVVIEQVKAEVRTAAGRSFPNIAAPRCAASFTVTLRLSGATPEEIEHVRIKNSAGHFWSLDPTTYSPRTGQVGDATRFRSARYAVDYSVLRLRDYVCEVRLKSGWSTLYRFDIPAPGQRANLGERSVCHEPYAGPFAAGLETAAPLPAHHRC